jgi:glutamyl-tRNA(Gln) amidotransferase subunit E
LSNHFVVKIGLEMHQQLDTGKLFCRCPGKLSDRHEFTFTRVLRPVVSELGKLDRAALIEARRGKTTKYFASTENSCAVEWDEEPPHDPDTGAIIVASQIARLMNAKLVDEVHFMRKILIDGSAVTGFQRTALIATDGEVEGVKIPTICLEEDSARPVEGGFSLDRLGIPLVEVATDPSMTSGEQAGKVAKKIGTIFRMAKVKRGLGTIRQDLNVSIPEGARVEVKGVQDLSLIPTVVRLEVSRQKNLAKLKKRFRGKFGKTKEVTALFKKTESRLFRNKKVFAVAFHGAAGLFAERLHARKHVGQEVAEYVKSFGYGGFVHSDERRLPPEMAKVGKSLGAKKSDLIIVAAGDRQIIDLIEERVREFSKGVPEDTRKANKDGSTEFLRPLPTGARMYPETDILPFRMPDVRPLETPKERLEKLKKVMPAQIAKKLHLSPDYHLFEELGRVPVLGVVITEYLPALRRKGFEVSTENIAEVLDLFKAKKLSKDALFDALKKRASGEAIDSRAVDPEDVRKFVEELVAKRKDYVLTARNPVKGLMGPVMKKYRGKFPGKWISLIIREEIEKLK